MSKRRIGGPINPPIEPYPIIDSSEWEVETPTVGSISQLTEYDEECIVEKHPIGFYEHQTKPKQKKKRRKK